MMLHLLRIHRPPAPPLKPRDRGNSEGKEAQGREPGFCIVFSKGYFPPCRSVGCACRSVRRYSVKKPDWEHVCPSFLFYVGPYLSSTPPDREVTRRQHAGLLHENCTPPRISPSRPHCVICGWAEVSLSPCAVMAMPAAVRQFRADGIALRKGSWRVTRRASLSRHMGMCLVNGYELVKVR